MDDYFKITSYGRVLSIQPIKKVQRIKKVERGDEFRKLLLKELVKQNEEDRIRNSRYC